MTLPGRYGAAPATSFRCLRILPGLWLRPHDGDTALEPGGLDGQAPIAEVSPRVLDQHADPGSRPGS